MQSLPISDAVTQYRDVYLASRNLAPLTRRNYLGDLNDVTELLGDRRGLVSVDQVQHRHLEGYLAVLDQRGLKGSSRRRKVSTIKSFFGFLVQQGTLPVSPADRLLPPERERDERRVLTEAEFKRLLGSVQHEVRDGAIIELLLQTGIRLSELTRLELDDVTLPARITKDPGNVGALRVQGKGRKGRFVTLNWNACKALKSYMAVRPTVDDPHPFITKFGRGIGPRAVEKLVAKYLQEAGICNASVHTLRHTFATHHVKQGTKLDVVRQALGHESLATTSVYVSLAREVMDQELQSHAL